jgi:multiple sugar transport system permease protein
MISSSLKPEWDVFAFPPSLIPRQVLWSNYPQAWTAIPYWRFTLNTLIIAIPTLIGVLLSNSLVAYSFSMLKWPGRDTLFFLSLCTMMVPYQVTMIPLFVLFARIGWTGTYLPLIVPAFFGSSYYVFLLRQFLLTIPRELSDAAMIDGASPLRVYASIAMPLMRPALAVVSAFHFIGVWGDYLAPLIYIRREHMYTLALGLTLFRSMHNERWALLMAASVTATIPIIVLFFLMQRTFIEGITLTGIKG